MMPKDCNRFDDCSAPLCPMDESSLKNGIWYPDEEICRSQEYCQLNWIRNQKKIASKCRNTDFYFTLEMLSRDCIIGKGIEGIDPDRTDVTEQQQVKRWLAQHPEKPKMDQAKREELAKRLKKTKPGLDPLKNDAVSRENLDLNRQSAGQNLT